MRQIALDTETTGFSPEQGHKIIEIGCIEIIDRRITGEQYHQYINPDREIDQGAINVHGITNEFLSDKPLFEEIVADFLTFISDSELVIHNAPFDLGFLNHEVHLIDKKKKKIQHVNKIIDTLVLARKKHIGQRNSLDALCKRYKIDNSNRTLHGALLDADLLARVFLAMTGGQKSILEQTAKSEKIQTNSSNDVRVQKSWDIPLIAPTTDELVAHNAWIKKHLEGDH